MSPAGLPVVGLPPPVQAALLWRDPIGQLHRWSRCHGAIFGLRLPVPGTVVVVGEPTAAHQLLISDPGSARTGTATGQVLSLLGPGCVLRQDGESHRARRRLLSPVFRGGDLDSRADLIAAVADRELARWPAGRRGPALPVLQDIAFAVITQLVLGIDDPAHIGQLHAAVRRLSSPAALAGTWLSPVAEGRVRTRVWQRWLRRRAEVDRLLTTIVARRCETAAPGADALGLLLGLGPTGPEHLESRDQGRQLEGVPAGGAGADTALLDELGALLTVGHETTATALGWGVERLAHQPAVAGRLTQSLAAGDDAYLLAFIHEVLRWRPPVVDAVRQLTEPVRVLGHRLPAGTLVMVSPVLVHHDADSFPQPDTFRPERFLDHRLGETGGWIPFGGGRRYCLGAELAQLEMQIVITRLLRVATVLPAGRRPEPNRLHGTMVVPGRGSRVILERRPVSRATMP